MNHGDISPQPAPQPTDTLNPPSQAKSKPFLWFRIRCRCSTTFIRINVTFIDKDGEKHHFQVAKGDNLLDIAQANDLEMEGRSLRLRHINYDS